MQQVVHCRNCGIQVSIDTSLKVDQICPECQTVLAVVKKNPATQPHVLPPNASLPPQDPYAPDPLSQQSQSNHPQPHPQQSPNYEPFTPQAAAFHSQKNHTGQSNTKLIVGLSIGGGILAVLLVVVIILLSGGNPSESEENQTAAANNASTAQGSETVQTPSEFSTAEFKPLPSLTTDLGDEDSVAYKFRSVKSTTYDFKYQLRGSESVTITGTNRLSASTSSPSKLLGPEYSGEATGSCFFVHPNGLAVTCHHVVEGAEKVQVRVDNQWHQADVVGVDAKNDLALLKIDVDDLPVLPIASSNQLALAQSVHIIGYPIQDVLGSSVKFNSGAITGFKKDDGASEVFFDANINPGNSGGPMIDQSGNVVGVATAMIQFEGLNSVAVAVMSDRILDLLEKHKISLPVSKTEQPQGKNSDLAKRTTPPVCLVKTDGRTDMQVMDHYTSLSLSQKTPPADVHGQIVVDKSGEILRYDRESGGGVCLFTLSPSTVGIEKLSLNQGDKWQYKGAKLVVVPQVTTKYVPADPGYTIRGRFGVRPFSGPATGAMRRQSEATIGLFLGLETAIYTKTGEDENFKTFKVLKYVQSPEPVRGREGYLSSRMVGTMKYDKKKGRIQECLLRGVMAATLDKDTKSYSVIFEYSVEGSKPSGSLFTDNKKKPSTGASSSVPSKPVLKESNWRGSSRAAKGISKSIKVDELDERTHFVSGAILSSLAKFSFSPDSRFLFSAARRIHVFDTQKKALVFESDTLSSHVAGIAVARNVPRIALAEGKDIRVVEYDQNGKLTELTRLTGASDRCSTIAISDDGKTIVAGYLFDIKIWNVDERKLLNKVKAGQTKAIHINSKEMKAKCLGNSMLTMIDLKSGNKIDDRKLVNFGAADFSKDGDKLAFCNGGMVHELILDGDGKPREYEGGGSPNVVRFHPDDDRLVTLHSGKVSVWNPKTRFRMDEYSLGNTHPFAMVLSPDGKYMAINYSSCAIVIQFKDR